jgi:hypothetical protein
MKADFNTVSLEVFLEGLRDPTREVIGASLELEIRATLVDHMVASCIRRQWISFEIRCLAAVI